ncbi:putative ribonuclease H-like domain-containing protein, partial [Tanacetum coccineum]
MVAAAKLPVLNPGKFKLWKMRIKQYFLMTDYALWEVIVNGDSPPPKRTVDGVEQTYPPTTAKEKLARKNELKARGTLLMALPNEHQLKFNSYKNTKSLMEAIEKRFGGNKESKKVHKTLLKQQYENFNGKSLEGLDQIYGKLQKLISQLEIHGETISQEDVNMKLLRSLPSETNEAVKTAHGVSAVNSKNTASTLPNIDSLSDAEIDLKWQMAMLTMRAMRFLKKTGRNLGVNGTDTIGFNKTKVECYNCHRRGHFAREYRAPRNQDNRNREITRRTVLVEETTLNALVSYSSSSSSSDTDVSTYSKACLKSYETLKEHYDNLTKDFNKSQLNVGAYKAGLESVEARLDVYKKNEAVFEEDINILKLDIMLRENALTELRKKFEKAEKERDDLKLTLEKFENSSKNLSKLLDSQVSDKFKTGVGYDSQVFDSKVFDSQVNDKYITGEGYHAVPPPYTGNFMPSKPDLVLADKVEYVFSESKPKSFSEPLIEDWISDSENENETEFKQKSSRATVSVNTARPISTAYPRPTVNCARPASNVFNRVHSHVRRHFNKFTTNKNNNFNEKVNIVLGNVTTVGTKAIVSDNKGNEANAVKASACWVWRPKQKVLDHLELQEKGVIDSGCSRHMTGNKSYLLDYEEIDGGFVAFGGNPKG